MTQPKLFSRPFGISLLLVIAVVFGSNHIAARIAFDHGVNVVSAVAIRSGGTALALLALLTALRVPLRLPAPTLGRAVIIGLVLAVQSYCLYSSVARLPVALALLAFNIYPMLFALMSWAAGMERPAPRTLIAMPVALVGLALALDVAGKSGGLAARWGEIGAGVGFAVAAALAFALVLLLSARWLKGMDGRLRSCLTMGTCGAAVAAVAAASGTFALPGDGMGWLGLALLTLLYGSAITALFMLQPHLSAASDVVALNFEPVAVLILGWAILDQGIAPLQIAGALIVIGAIVALGTARR